MPALSPPDPGSQLDYLVRRLSTGQQWYKSPHASYENTSGFEAEKSLMGSPPNCCKEIKRLHVCSGKVDLDPSHPEGYPY